MKPGDIITIWIVGEGPVPFKAKVSSTLRRVDGCTSAISVRPIAADGREAEIVLTGGQFVVSHLGWP